MIAAGRVAGLVALFLVCAPLHFASKFILRRSAWPPRFLGAAAWICGARVRVSGTPAAPHSLLLANHISWLDILVLGGATGSAFVAKDDLGHPLVHWLADLNNTVYVRREQRRAAKDQAVAIAAALACEQPVTVFPEGAVGPGDHLLPFHSTLLEAGALAGRDVVIRPVALDYGKLAEEISWFGESGKDNVLRVLGRRGTIPVAVTLLDPLAPGDRKQLARQAREAIGASLGFKSDAHSPIAPAQ
ncbi:MAG: 1-acyl-sn-glycerol-3-phosphate acyltransferase [uncultured Sphingomonas sp.]|uniref:1-acyl-sn-glycerol-3-phosphate acyltransferase n=1 Tax=uncultured Sphingomonas sp. TaxID=158754 RepID=A0A6J4SF71_9SPHN|nr:MAG: 1-acyl-sn-glycerol-3-phosphate acyltransferase [uncultured Sphingomonas sp.]